jgi:hypothetical protein
VDSRIAVPRLTGAADEDHRPLRLLRLPEIPEPWIEQELTYLSTNPKQNYEVVRGKIVQVDFVTVCSKKWRLRNSNRLTREVNVGEVRASNINHLCLILTSARNSDRRKSTKQESIGHGRISWMDGAAKGTRSTAGAGAFG